MCWSSAGNDSLLDSGTISFPFDEVLPLNTGNDARAGRAAVFPAKKLEKMPTDGEYSADVVTGAATC